MAVTFSIIVPVYKVEDYLHECVDSILAQDYPNFELVLVDDGSPDNCPQICDDYAEKDSRVKVIHKTNGGLSDSRNTGIKSATGDYLIFIDSDDYWEGSHHLGNLAKILEKDKTIDTIILNNRLYYENTDTFFSKPIAETDGIVDNPNVTLYNLVSMGKQASAAWLRVVRRSMIIDNNIFFEKGLLGEDSDWFIHLSLHVKKYYEYKEYVYIYRQNRKGSITATIKLKNVEDQFYMIDKWLAVLEKDKVDKTLDLAIKGFLAYLLSIVVYLVSKLPEAERKKMIPEISKRKHLFQFAINKKSKLTALLCRVLGVGLTSGLLSKLYKMRSKSRMTS